MRLSIIIPALCATPELECCIASVRAGRNDLEVELILSGPQQDDSLRAAAKRLDMLHVGGPQGRGGQMRRGAERATSDWYLFLHADSILPFNWGAIVAAHIRKRLTPAAFRLAFRATGFGAWQTAAWANLRTRLGLPYGDQGLLISRLDYVRCGGHLEIPLMEDVAIARALGGNITLLPVALTTDAGKYESRGWYRQGLSNLMTLTKYLAGVAPETLARNYASHRKD